MNKHYQYFFLACVFITNGFLGYGEEDALPTKAKPIISFPSEVPDRLKKRGHEDGDSKGKEEDVKAQQPPEKAEDRTDISNEIAKAEAVIKEKSEGGDGSKKKVEEVKPRGWSYKGETGPAYWGDLKVEYQLAKNGKEQSPIDIRNAIYSLSVKPLRCEYGAEFLKIENNGHTVKVNFHDGGYLSVGERKFKLMHFHFHAPSEHTVNGKHYPMEMHLVHRDANGVLGVVGIFFKEGNHHEGLEAVWRHLPNEVGAVQEVSDVMIHPRSLLPEDLRYVSYPGSLTTPPCTEGVHWHVVMKPVEISRGQLEKFREIYSGNHRPPQPLYQRMVRRMP